MCDVPQSNVGEHTGYKVPSPLSPWQAYSCPQYFGDDWLNDWYDSLHDNKEVTAVWPDSVVTRDYRFVYLGPAVRYMS